jgi:iron complex outermembrane receptor protein
VTWGAGYRLLNDSIEGVSVYFDPERRTDHLVSLFLQDQISLLSDRLKLTIGSKFEDNDYTGFEFQPTARALWRVKPRHSIWTAVSRAVRTPSRADEDVSFFGTNRDPAVLVFATGNRGFDSEELLAYEIGYRTQLSDELGFDLAAYYHDYDSLRSVKLGRTPLPTPPFPPGTVPGSFGNETEAVGYGVEVSANWNVTDYWALSGWYTLMKLDVEADPDNADAMSEGQEDDTPTNQVHMRSRLNLPWNLEFDTYLFYVGDVSHQDADEYTRLDLRLGWRPIESIEVSVAGQNLTERRHEEFGTGLFSLRSSIPRSLYAKVTWRY